MEKIISKLKLLNELFNNIIKTMTSIYEKQRCVQEMYIGMLLIARKIEYLHFCYIEEIFKVHDELLDLDEQIKISLSSICFNQDDNFHPIDSFGYREMIREIELELGLNF